jgi:hypothetical protein
VTTAFRGPEPRDSAVDRREVLVTGRLRQVQGPKNRRSTASPACCDRPEAVSFHHRTVPKRHVALRIPDPDAVGSHGLVGKRRRGPWAGPAGSAGRITWGRFGHTQHRRGELRTRSPDRSRGEPACGASDRSGPRSLSDPRSRRSPRPAPRQRPRLQLKVHHDKSAECLKNRTLTP